MDNASFHKSEKMKRLIIDAKCSVLYLPPYSPALNPIEKFWANLKRFVARIMVNFEKLSEAVDRAFSSLSQMAWLYIRCPAKKSSCSISSYLLVLRNNTSLNYRLEGLSIAENLSVIYSIPFLPVLTSWSSFVRLGTVGVYVTERSLGWPLLPRHLWYKTSPLQESSFLLEWVLCFRHFQRL